jgi:DNA-binding CsgD family transcriptional regulator
MNRMPVLTDALEQGRAAFRQHDWTNACTALSAADHIQPLEIDDLARLAVAAYLIGRDEESSEAWTRAHGECIRLGDVPRAARCAFWLVLALFGRGEVARADGWLSRALRLVEETHTDCAERGLLLVLVALGALTGGDASGALEKFRQAATIGDRFNDTELKVFGRLGQGQAHALSGRSAEAVVLFDEIMVAVTIGEVSPIAVGIVYCAVIDACHDILDVRRIREWTTALARWCGAQPDLVPFRGPCLVHRAEVMRISGDLDEAIAEAERACRWLADRTRRHAGGAGDLSLRAFPAAGAFYQLGEIHRVRGAFPEAEEAYRRASEYGPVPQPGLALLRLAQGRAGAAGAAIRHALDGPRDRLSRAHILAACVEIMIAVRDPGSAHAAADELAGIAGEVAAGYAHGLSADAQGRLLLAEGNARAALSALRNAWIAWQEVDAPYEAARVRVLMGRCHGELGDQDSAVLELQAAQRVFERLRAAPDLAEVAKLLRSPSGAPPGKLTRREAQVIALLAAGRTNRSIAEELGISERTVDRHVSNIFMKLEVSSRTAATAYAWEHGLV